MFNNHNFSHMEGDDPDLKTFINIKRSKLYKFAAHTTMFPFVEAISWITKQDVLEMRYILNDKVHPITSFEALIIYSCYHLEDGERPLDKKLIKKFPHSPKELLKA